MFFSYFRVSGQVPSQEENENTTYPSGVPRELSLILKEIKVINVEYLETIFKILWTKKAK